MPIEAGRYEPIQAIVRYKITGTGVEPLQTTGDFCTRSIRFPYMARTGAEAAVQAQQKSFGQTAIRMRRDAITEQIDPTMQIVWRGKTYGIITINDVPSDERDEIEFLTQIERAAAVRTS